MLIKKDNLKNYARLYAQKKGFRLSTSFYNKLDKLVEDVAVDKIKEVINTSIPRAKGHNKRTIYDYDI